MSLLVLFVGCEENSSSRLDPPYPKSEVISDLIWGEKIQRQAHGSDTWPMTWADDDNIYTAWADGSGFENTPRLSLGFGKIEGTPESFSGFNVRSESGEQYGDGPSGKKASGMLMVDGLLLMWVRNADQSGNHCQLAWSSDYAKSWEWSDWVFEDFGYCSFLNFGKNYINSRDDYIYTYTPDVNSAYSPGDQLVIMRVIKNKFKEKDAYEFFSGYNDNEIPQWSTDKKKREGIFNFPGYVMRHSVSYNNGLKRYLMWMQIPRPTIDTRFAGGFGVYDASEPWGPWTTVFFTEKWDTGPGETANFPTKWMSENGEIIHLVFSGNDSLSVREGKFFLHQK
jgi:hypothetical protein